MKQTYTKTFQDKALEDHVRELMDNLSSKVNFPKKREGLSAGVSGGADSVAMILLAKYNGLDLRVIHVDHGMREDTLYEKRLVDSVAKFLDYEVTWARGHVDPSKGNVEARARDLRLSFFNEDTMTGHTINDRVESVILNMMRGSGLDGLIGMEASHKKPILGLTREETELVCKAFDIEPFMDPTNSLPIHRRNRVRNELVPLLADIFDRDPINVINKQSDRLQVLSNYINNSCVTSGDISQLANHHPYEQVKMVNDWWKDTPESGGYSLDEKSIKQIINMVTKTRQPVTIKGGFRVTVDVDGRIRVESYE